MRERLAGLGRLPVWAVVATVAGVGAFGLAQPLLDLLGRNPEFFIARRFPARDIILLTVALLAIPVVSVVPALLLRLAGRIPAAIAHLITLAFWVAVTAATVLVALGLTQWSPGVFFGVAAAAGILVAWAFLRFTALQTALTYLGLAPIVFGLWFAFATPTSQLLSSSPSDLPEAGGVENPVPVVILVFDEFPLATVMHADKSLDATHYPNLAELASDGVWYRNAVGVRQQTEEAIPALLTGVGVSTGSIPTIVDHPFNLFTLLSDAYDIAAVENVTELCPGFVCANESRPVEPVRQRWGAVLADLDVVYRHLIFPDAWRADLPPIDQGWGGFDQDTAEEFDIIERFLEKVADDRRLETDRFLATFDDRTDLPPLRFAHFLLPHHPWDLTPDGRVHGAPRPPGRFEVGWGSDPFLVAQGWQRHLLQAAYVDTVIGRVIDRLRRDGLYDEALVVLLADHGITIHPDTEHQRVVNPDTIGSVAAIPMFVKYPTGMAGAPEPGTIDDLRAETTDLVPTVAAVVDVAVPWSVDGLSLLDLHRRGLRTESVMIGSRGAVEIPATDNQAQAVAAEKESWFPDSDPFRLTPRGWEDLLGSTASGEDVDGVSLAIDQEGEIAGYVPGSDPVPSYLSGTLRIEEGVSASEIVAVSVDGVVVAVTYPYEVEGTLATWEAMIDPARVDSGSVPRAWRVEGDAGSPEFTR